MRLLRFAGVIAMLVVAIGLAFVLVNQFDEELRPEVAGYYRSGVTRELAAQDGFALLAGFSAPRDQDPREWGVAWTRSVAQAIATKQRLPQRVGRLRVVGAEELRCTPETADCVERYGRNPATVKEMALDNALLLKRYLELQAQPDIAEAGLAAAMEAPIADYEVLIHTHTLLLSQIAIRAATGEVSDALEALANDARFWRRALSQGRTLIAKMIAVRCLSRDLLLATQISRRMKDSPAAHWQALREVARPIAPKDMSTSRPVRFEAASLQDFVERLRLMDRATLSRDMHFSPLRADLMKFMLPNATLNFAHRRFALWEQLDEVPSDELASRIAVVKDQSRKLAAPDATWFYNPTGKWIAAEGAADWDFDEYVLRMRDVDALARLACSVISLQENRVPAGAVAGHLAKAEAGCADPYSARPMAWDAEKGVLWFAPRGRKTVERFGGSGDRVAIAPY